MGSDSIESIEIALEMCSGLSQTKGAVQLLELLRVVGAEIRDLARDLQPDPLEAIDDEGDITVPLLVQHPLFLPDPVTPHDYIAGMAELSFVQGDRSLALGQSAFFYDRTKVNPLAQSQLAFASVLYPHLHPKYGWIDERGQNLPSTEGIESATIQYIFWANFFGPEYVQHYGRDFLLHAPGWKAEELTSGGIVYVATERYTEWRSYDQRAIARYFQTRDPHIRLYRPALQQG